MNSDQHLQEKCPRLGEIIGLDSCTFGTTSISKYTKDLISKIEFMHKHIVLITNKTEIQPPSLSAKLTRITQEEFPLYVRRRRLKCVNTTKDVNEDLCVPFAEKEMK